MFTEPIHVTDEAFEKTVLQAALPTVVDFWAPWCGPCRTIGPFLEKIAKDYAGKLVVAKVNTDENPVWAEKYGVRGIPTLLFVARGQVLHTQVGVVQEPFLRDIVDEFLSAAAGAKN